MKGQYTEAFHAARLLQMLEAKEPCEHCPGGMIPCTEACPVCLSFVDIAGHGNCPCYFFGEQEAIKRTWLALEAKGYLE